MNPNLKLIEQIEILLQQLKASLAPNGTPWEEEIVTAPKSGKPKQKKAVGPMAGIRLIVEEGRLNEPKQPSEINDMLKQEGRHYSGKVVGVALLRLVRERVLVRLLQSGTWLYAVRK